MRWIAKFTRWTLWGAAILLSLVLLLHVGLYFGTNSDWVKQRIAAQIGGFVDTHLTYDALHLMVLPRPHLTLDHGRFATAQGVSIQAVALSVFPKLRPLINGRMVIERLTIDSPNIALKLTGSAPGHDRMASVPLAEHLRQSAAAAMGFMAHLLGDGQIEILNGRLSISSAGRGLLDIDRIDGSLTCNQQALTLTLTLKGHSDLADNIAAHARIGLQGPSVSGQLALSGCQTRAWRDLFSITADLPEADVNLVLNIDSPDLHSWHIGLESRHPTLAVKSGTRQVTLKEVVGRAVLDLTPTHWKVSLNELSLAWPRLHFTGEAIRVAGHQGQLPLIRLDLQGQELDLGELRAATLALLEGIPTVWQIILGGSLSDIHLTSTQSTWDDLISIGNLNIAALANHGHLLIPRVDLELTQVTGQVAFEKGILAGQNATARYGASTGRKGQLRLALFERSRSMDLSLQIDADLAQLPPILKEVVHNAPFQTELAQVSLISGKAIGELKLTGPLNQLDVAIAVEQCSGEVDYARLPYRLALTRGQFTYSDQTLTWHNLAGHVKSSGFSALTGKVDWNGAPNLDLEEGAFHLSGDEVFAWLKQTLGPDRPFTSVDTLSGWIDIDHLDVNGPPSRPRQWRFTAQGRVADLNIATAKLDAPVSVTTGRFTADPRQFSLSDARVHLWDATVEGSVTIGGYTTDQPDIELKQLKGSVGPQALQWIHRQLDLPERFRSLLPLDIATAQGRWQRHNGLTIDSQLTWQNQQLHVSGEVELGGSEPRVALTLFSPAWDLATLDQAFPTGGSAPAEPMQPTRLRGKMAIRVDRLIHGRHVLQPFEAIMDLQAGQTVIDITHADLCGIATTGQALWTSQGIRLDLRPQAVERGLQYTGGCLAGAHSTERMEGLLDLDGTLKTTGHTRAQLAAGLQGNLQIDIQKGRITNVGSVGLFTNLLAFLKINNLLSGAGPNFGEKDFPFDRLNAQLEVQGEILSIKEAALRADAVNMVGEGTISLATGKVDLTILVSPLTTVDTLVRNIPIVGNILQGTLVAIPVGVSGDLQDPTIVPLSPIAIGSRVLGIFTRLLKTPFRLIEPILPSAPETKEPSVRTP